MPVTLISKPNRKFQDVTFYDKAQSSYYLMPFRFHRLNSHREVLVNEVGDHLVVPTGTVERVVKRKIHKDVEQELYGDLVANFFISEEIVSPLIDIVATRYRTKKSFLDQFTSLHLFVITLRCEHTCHYCQVSRVTSNKDQFDMSVQHINKGIELMLLSPSEFLTMEFQGGEALLAFDKIVYAIERTKNLALEAGKKITYVICTNLAVLDEEILSYCKENRVLLSTSLDGPGFIHNQNRRRPGNNSYELTVKGIELYPRLMLGIPVYADYYQVHDYIVQAKDAFNQTILGLHNLARYGVRLEVRVVLQKQSIPRLTRLAKYIYKNLPFVEHVTFMGLEYTGYTPFNIGK